MATVLPSIEAFAAAGPVREQALQQLSTWINDDLTQHFESNRALGREHLASTLIEKVENLVSNLDSVGYSFGRVDYGGDINFENSYQTFSNGEEMMTGIILEFQGFSCNVSWSDKNE